MVTLLSNGAGASTVRVSFASSGWILQTQIIMQRTLSVLGGTVVCASAAWLLRLGDVRLCHRQKLGMLTLAKVPSRSGLLVRNKLGHLPVRLLTSCCQRVVFRRLYRHIGVHICRVTRIL